MKSVLLCIAAILWCCVPTAFATHVAALEIGYRHLGNNLYEINVMLYHECTGGQYINSCRVDIGSSSGCGTQSVVLGRINAPIDISQLCPSVPNRCQLYNAYMGAQLLQYRGTVSLNSNCQYTIATSEFTYSSITNINTRGGITAYTTLDTRYPNATPTYTTPSYLYAQINRQHINTNTFIEEDGDSLVFALDTPVYVPSLPTVFANGTFGSGLSASNPLANATVSLDPRTGEFRAFTSQQQIARYAIEVSEYRQGILIARSHRALLLSVVTGASTSQLLIDSVTVRNPFTGIYERTTNYEIPTCALTQTNCRVYLHSTDSSVVQRDTTLHTAHPSQGGSTIHHQNMVYLSSDSSQAVFEFQLMGGLPSVISLPFFTESCPTYAYNSVALRTIPTQCGTLKGNIFHDANRNCIWDTTEVAIPNSRIEITHANTVLNIGTNFNNGYFQLSADTGTYFVRPVLSPTYLWQPVCLTQTTTTLLSDTSVRNLAFGYIPASNCPVMQVEIAGSSIRACTNRYATLQYQNKGTVIALNPYILVTVDTPIVIVAATQPFISLGNGIYRFDFNTIAPSAQASTITLTLNTTSCNVLPSSTAYFCLEARIYPDSFCGYAPAWDRSDIHLYSTRISHNSTEFKIKNKGDAMTLPQTYRVIEYDTVRLMSSYQLGAGDSLIIPYGRNHTELFLQADQSPAHPYAPQTIVAANLYTQISTRFPQYDDDDNAPSVSRTYVGSSNSYDPNNKEATPCGWGNDHLIPANQVLEYQINFQNTGTDTAFVVVLTDSISPLLDIATLQLGAASHRYTWQLVGRELRIQFDSIYLADSTTNEPASHGFIAYEIHQLPNNPIGSRIENTADIYFDYNAPIRTNTTFHTIGENFLPISLVLSDNEAATPSEFQFSIMPNPTTHYTTVCVQGADIQTIEAELYDQLGRKVQTYATQQQSYLRIERQNLPAGVYVVQVRVNGALVRAGKLVIH